MSYKKIWHMHKKEIEKELAYYKKEKEDKSSKEVYRMEAKYEALNILHHRIKSLENDFHLEETETRQKQKDLD